MFLTGYSTVTFQNPYLGNTCVPFQHWACSKQCASAIDGPAKKLQLEGAKKWDYEYSHYVARSSNLLQTTRETGLDISLDLVNESTYNLKKKNSCCSIC